MKTSKKILTASALASVLFLQSSPAAIVADFRFDSNAPAGTSITSVTSNGITLNTAVVTNGVIKSSSLIPSNSGSTTSLSADFTAGDFMVSPSVVSAFNFAANQAFTIDGWFSLGSVATNQGIFSNRGTPATGGVTISLDSGRNQLLFQVRAAGGTLLNLWNTSSGISANTWYYFVAYRDSSGNWGQSLYSSSALLGSVVGSSGSFAGAINSDSKTYIGRLGDAQGGGPISTGGKISEIRISDTVLLPSEYLWTSAAIPEPGVAALWSGFGALASVAFTRRSRRGNDSGH